MAWTEVGLKRMLTDWLYDSQRRKQVIATISVERWLPTMAVFSLIVGVWTAAWMSVIVVLFQWLIYEFLLEPYTDWVGPYWERTPPDGRTFIKW